MASTINKCQAKKAGNCRDYRNGRFCMKHRAQIRAGLINEKGEKLREKIPINSWKKRFTDCIAKDSGVSPCCKWKRSRFCNTHWVQYKLGIIDFNGKKLRDKIKIEANKICLAKDAGPCKGPMVGRFCNRHSTQHHRGYIDDKGNKVKELKNPHRFNECVAKDSGAGPCSKYINGRFCGRHRHNYDWGIIDENGKVLRKKIAGTSRRDRLVCSVKGCKDPAGYKCGFCRFHYEEIVRRNKFEKYPIIPISKFQMVEEKKLWYEG